MFSESYGNVRQPSEMRRCAADTYDSELRVCRASHSLVTPGDVYLGQDQNCY